MTGKTTINNYYGAGTETNKSPKEKSELKAPNQKKIDRRIKRRESIKNNNSLLLEEIKLVAVSLGNAIQSIFKIAYYFVVVVVLGFLVFAEAPEGKKQQIKKGEEKPFEIKI